LTNKNILHIILKKGFKKCVINKEDEKDPGLAKFATLTKRVLRPTHAPPLKGHVLFTGLFEQLLIKSKYDEGDSIKAELLISELGMVEA
jgi:hypothetical protein